MYQHRYGMNSIKFYYFNINFYLISIIFANFPMFLYNFLLNFLLSWCGASSWCQENYSNHFCSSGRAERTIENLSQFCRPKLLIFHAQCRKTNWVILFPEKNMFKTFSWTFKLVLSSLLETFWWRLEGLCRKSEINMEK